MATILICIPIRPGLNPVLKQKCEAACYAMFDANPKHEIGAVIDYCKIEPRADDNRTWSKIARARNRMLENIDLSRFDYILWIDADVVQYPPDMPTRLIDANPDGISAPFVLVEDSKRFYDTAAFIIKGSDIISPTTPGNIPGRNVGHDWPYWPTPRTDNVVEMDCVGTVTLVPTKVYRDGAKYDNHPAFTDHYPICKAHRDASGKVVTVLDCVAYHADLPRYAGEGWH